MYNKTEKCAESLPCVIFGYQTGDSMGADFIPYDNDGCYDGRLWDSTDKWIKATEKDRDDIPKTLREAEDREVERAISEHFYYDDFCVMSLNSITGDAKEALDKILSLKNGIYVPRIHYNLIFGNSKYQATRYIDGFHTNERIEVMWGGDDGVYEHTAARFNQEDLNKLPDLMSAIDMVKIAFDNGKITPPHIENYEELKLRKHEFFGWYAKTDNGVIGVVRVDFMYDPGFSTDDAYFIIEYGESECRPISRDDLLDRLGECEATYIFDGEYNENEMIYALMPEI